MKKIEKLAAHVNDLESRLTIAKNKLRGAQQQAETPAERLAIYLHDRFCRFNHTNGCEWGYENGWTRQRMWAGYAHKRWLAEAEEVVQILET